jgi:hypothetical protein
MPIAAHLLLYVLTHIVRFLTREQAAALCGLSVERFEPIRRALVVKGYLHYQVYPIEVPAPVCFGTPVYVSDGSLDADRKRLNESRYRWVAARLRLSAADHAQRPLMRAHLLWATAKAVNHNAGTLPNTSHPEHLVHDMNVSGLVVWAHERMMSRLRRDMPAADDTDGATAEMISPLIGGPPLSVPADPGPLCSPSGRARYSLDALDTHPRALVGEDQVRARGIEVGSQRYVPDLAFVDDDRVVHAVDYSADYRWDRIKAVIESCAEAGITLELHR